MTLLEVLLAKGSALRYLKTKNVTKLRIVDISDTFVSMLPIQLMPELQHLQVQGSIIHSLDLRNIMKL